MVSLSLHVNSRPGQKTMRLYLALPCLFCVLGLGTVRGETDPLLLQLLDRVEFLEKQGQEQRQRIRQLEDDVRELKSREPACVVNSDILIEATDVTAKNNDVIVTGNDEKPTNTDDFETPRLSKKIKHNSNVVHGLKRSHGISDTKTRRFLLDTEYACFHASLDSGLYDHNHLSQILVFDQVKLNFGDAYNNKTGIFVTPITGLYIFSLSVRGVGNHTHVDIMKNGEEVGAVYVQDYDQGSVTIATHLYAGDTMHAGFQRHEDVPIWGDKLTSFMGCLITPLE